MNYLIQIGRVTQLCLAEAQSLFTEYTLEVINDQFVMVQDIEEATFLDLIKQSGGLIKGFALVSQVEPLKEAVIEAVVPELSKERKPNFGLFIPKQLPFSISAQDVKNVLQKNGTPSRFVDSKSDGVSTALILHQDITEILLLLHEDQVIIGKNIWVQNIDDWSKRDYGKPKRNTKRGMLPPKLARIMINLVSHGIRTQQSKRLFDPFCGTGTVLMEGALTGWKTLGSDLSPEAVQDSAENIHWFNQEYTQLEPEALFISDATQISVDKINGKVDAIVTEPFLGKQKPSPKDLPNVFKGLEKMYWGAFKNWTRILKEGSEVVIICPLVETDKHTFSLESVIDKCKTLGYNVQSEPYIYRRPQTIIQRQIFHLRFK